MSILVLFFTNFRIFFFRIYIPLISFFYARLLLIFGGCFVPFQWVFVIKVHDKMIRLNFKNSYVFKAL
ncbi:hypothetical protein LEP1GSC170_0993 [Leptospira interrogans serovar Bataviae str. HAI135]|nr:hypothetical protein LEP1GSC170_0993 [Leptospira interrogans serovar Bataviae str. HAI135]